MTAATASGFGDLDKTLLDNQGDNVPSSVEYTRKLQKRMRKMPPAKLGLKLPHLQPIHYEFGCTLADDAAIGFRSLNPDGMTTLRRLKSVDAANSRRGALGAAFAPAGGGGGNNNNMNNAVNLSREKNEETMQDVDKVNTGRRGSARRGAHAGGGESSVGVTQSKKEKENEAQKQKSKKPRRRHRPREQGRRYRGDPVYASGYRGVQALHRRPRG